MTQPDTSDETPQAKEALESDEGVGATTTDEPDTFEPEEPTE
jgi:hypothetical protein